MPPDSNPRPSERIEEGAIGLSAMRPDQQVDEQLPGGVIHRSADPRSLPRVPEMVILGCYIYSVLRGDGCIEVNDGLKMMVSVEFQASCVEFVSWSVFSIEAFGGAKVSLSGGW